MWRFGGRRGLGALQRLSGRTHRNVWRGKSDQACERALQYKVGEKIHGFTVNQVTSVPELFLTAVKLSHDSTGARYLHLAREDKNNLFSVQFRTTPMDSTGVPHVLEHTVLCGSQKYPCRDPFFKMLNRSLSTFMNAFTASDYTMYPFSTQNPKDFQNLLSVYLDATFFPCLRELDFWCEGWRLEHENPSDPQTPLIFKGVVFNEMKGAFTDNERIFSQHLQNKLLPDHTYSVVSGGDPLCIPELTWEQLKEFHATHYHPSNARFFTYGNFQLEQHLKQIQEEALSKFQKMEQSTVVPAQKHWDKPREFHIACGPDSLATDASKQTTVSVSFLLPDITDTFEAFTLNLLSSLLISGPNSPFYKALIESGLGTDFSPDVGYNGYTREAYFSIGLQGISEKDVRTVKELVDKTIEEVIEKGFEDDRIEALLHKIEIQMKHQSTSFGLALTSVCVFLVAFAFGLVLVLVLCCKTKPQLFPNYQHLGLDSGGDEEHRTWKLGVRIAHVSFSLSISVFPSLGLELRTQQSKPQDASCLPALKVSDIEPSIPFIQFDVSLAAGDIPVQYCAQPTNGVVYFRAFCSLNTLPEELRPYVPLFCSVLTKLGCGILDYREQAQQIELKTGGMTVSPQVLPDDSHLDTYEQGVLFSSLCLDRNLPDMMHLWTEIFNNPCFEEEDRFKVLVKMAAQELSNGIPDSGHLYAALRASKTLTPAADLQETFGGMDQVRLMKRIAEMTDVKPILRKLPRIKKYLLNCDNMSRCSVNATPQQMSQAEKDVGNFLRNVGRSKKERKPVRPHVVEKPAHSSSGGSGSQIVRKLIIVSGHSPCHVVSNLLIPHFSLKILARLMTAKFLHTEIREKGGAYGGGAKLGHNGIFTLYSYRDPNFIETLQSFGKAVDWAKSGKFTQQDIDEAKLSVFSSVDSPVAPSDKGILSLGTLVHGFHWADFHSFLSHCFLLT
uniref:Presequence protease, mitochondrial n=1 Tax=Nannospalax galili TaxID=1026970 RepID=A0A8C6R7D3_NANGA